MYKQRNCIRTYIHINTHTKLSLYMIQGLGISVSCEMKMGNIAPKATIKSKSLACCVSVLTVKPPTLPIVTPYPLLSVYVVPCLTMQCV